MLLFKVHFEMLYKIKNNIVPNANRTRQQTFYIVIFCTKVLIFFYNITSKIAFFSELSVLKMLFLRSACYFGLILHSLWQRVSHLSNIRLSLCWNVAKWVFVRRNHEKLYFFQISVIKLFFESMYSFQIGIKGVI